MKNKKSFRTVELSLPISELPGLHFITVKSKALEARADITVYLPRTKVSLNKLPIVTLLHGVYGSHWAWCLKGKAHKTVQRLIDQKKIPPMALVMPSDGLWGDGSGYVPHRNKNFEKWIVDEVPCVVRETLGVSEKGRKGFIAGLSMGGFGALRLGALYPKKYAAFSGHSSITDFSQMKQFVIEPLHFYRCADKNKSVFKTIFKNRKIIGPFRFDCGVDDPLIKFNQELHRELKKSNITHDYQEFSGTHEWKYWETHLEETLLFFGQHFNKVNR